MSINFELIKKVVDLQNSQRWDCGNTECANSYIIYPLIPRIQDSSFGFLILNGLDEEVRILMDSNLITNRKIIFSAQIDFELRNLISNKEDCVSEDSAAYVVDQGYSEICAKIFKNRLQTRNIPRKHWIHDSICIGITEVVKIKTIRIRIDFYKPADKYLMSSKNIQYRDDVEEHQATCVRFADYTKFAELDIGRITHEEYVCEIRK